MVENTRYIHARHVTGVVERESEEYRLGVVGPAQLRPVGDPESPDWARYYPEEAKAVQAAQADSAPAESPQPSPVQSVLRQESPVLP